MQKVASLPIRNWNDEVMEGRNKKEVGCEPTYKELKQLLSKGKHGYPESCEPTYKELKPTVLTYP